MIKSVGSLLKSILLFLKSFYKENEEEIKKLLWDLLLRIIKAKRPN
ncbi:hypothetical protein [Priestia megaterium]|nr:hypothetical protein [Priestia megaterium]